MRPLLLALVLLPARLQAGQLAARPATTAPVAAPRVELAPLAAFVGGALDARAQAVVPAASQAPAAQLGALEARLSALARDAQPQAALSPLERTFEGAAPRPQSVVVPYALSAAPVPGVSPLSRLVRRIVPSRVFSTFVPPSAPAPAPDPADEVLDAGELGRLTGAVFTKVAENIFHLNFPTQHLLAATFLRFQEHYESPEFAGKAFSWEEFMDWYAKENGKFSYLDDWSGFNIPSRVLDAFYRGDFNPLTRKEGALLELFKGLQGRYYIIGTFGDSADEGTLRHEIAHGLFYRDDSYREAAKKILATVDLKPVYAMLTKLGYAEHVLEDEAHAYLGDDLEFLKTKGIDPRPYKKAHRALLAIYRERSGRR